MKKNISIIKDENGNSIVVIHDVIFRNKQNIPWDDVEKYLAGTDITCALHFLYMKMKFQPAYTTHSKQNCWSGMHKAEESIYTIW